MFNRLRSCCRALGFLVLLVMLPSCFFETRAPEAGSSEVCFEEIPAVTIADVFTNLDESMRCFLASTYLDQLAENFEYIPAPGVGGLPDPWGKTEEEAFISRLFSDAESIESNLRLRDVSPPEGETTVLVEAEYTLRVTVDGSPILFAGEAFYTLEQVASTFLLTRWEEKSSASPMALLRAGS